MTGGLPLTVEHSVELLERALGYTRGRLAGVTPGNLRAPTPCAGWTVHDLFAHLDDAMDAFLEAADGRIALRPGGEVGSVAVVAVVALVQAKACALLGAWSGSPGRASASSRSATARSPVPSWWVRRPSRSPSTAGTWGGPPATRS